MRKKLQDTFRPHETVSEPCSKSCLIATSTMMGTKGECSPWRIFPEGDICGRCGVTEASIEAEGMSDIYVSTATVADKLMGEEHRKAVLGETRCPV